MSLDVKLSLPEVQLLRFRFIYVFFHFLEPKI